MEFRTDRSSWFSDHFANFPVSISMNDRQNDQHFLLAFKFIKSISKRYVFRNITFKVFRTVFGNFGKCIKINFFSTLYNIRNLLFTPNTQYFKSPGFKRLRISKLTDTFPYLYKCIRKNIFQIFRISKNIKRKIIKIIIAGIINL